MKIFLRAVHVVFVVFCLAIAACGNSGKLKGTYTSSVQSLTFNGDKVSVSILGKEIGKNWSYKVDGKNVTMTGPSGDVVYTINDDGSLSDPAKDKLVRK